MHSYVCYIIYFIPHFAALITLCFVIKLLKIQIGWKDNRKRSELNSELESLDMDCGLVMCVCVSACVCMRKAAYSFTFEYLYPNVCLSYSLTLSVRGRLSVFSTVCVCVLSLFKQVESFSLQDLPCALPGKNFFCSAIDFCICYKFRKHFTTQPRKLQLLNSTHALAPSLLSLSTVLQLLLSQG